MLTTDERARLAVVLVRARNPANIGAVARAMHDFGFAHLRAVSEYLEPVAAARSAVDAGAVLAAATTHPALAEAVADHTLVLGTTAVGDRVLEHPVWLLADAAAHIATHLRAGPAHQVALVFGSEKTGLSNAELAHCHALVTIPMHPHEGLRHASMNLGQAAAVCLYELVRTLDTTPARPADTPLHPAEKHATAAETDRLRSLLIEVLEHTGYTRRYPANSDEHVLRRLVLRTRPAAADIGVWMGVLRQVLWSLRSRPRTANKTDDAVDG